MVYSFVAREVVLYGMVGSLGVTEPEENEDSTIPLRRNQRVVTGVLV